MFGRVSLFPIEYQGWGTELIRRTVIYDIIITNRVKNTRMNIPFDAESEYFLGQVMQNKFDFKCLIISMSILIQKVKFLI